MLFVAVGNCAWTARNRRMFNNSLFMYDWRDILYF